MRHECRELRRHYRSIYKHRWLSHDVAVYLSPDSVKVALIPLRSANKSHFVCILEVPHDPLNGQRALHALEATGAQLASWQSDPIELVIAGGTAGLLGRVLSPTRTTADCDVMWVNDPGAWDRIERAAEQVAAEQQLPRRWLNRDCTTYAWTLMLDWRSRCEPVATFGPLVIRRLSRVDLIATKVMGAPKRPQDLDDLMAMRPTASELTMIVRHVDRLEAEDLDRRAFDAQRLIIRSLGGLP